MNHQNLNPLSWRSLSGDPADTKVLHIKAAGQTTWQYYGNISSGFEYQRAAEIKSENYNYSRLTGGCNLPELPMSDGFATMQQLLRQGWKLVDQDGNIVGN
jgi:hypothetical protein